MTRSAQLDPTRRKSVDHTLRYGLRSILRSVVKRDDFDTPDLETLAGLRADLDEAIAVAVHNLRHHQGHSWAEVAAELGVTRQEAHRRYHAATWYTDTTWCDESCGAWQGRR